MAAEQGATTEPLFAPETAESVPEAPPHHDADAVAMIPETGIANTSYSNSNDRDVALSRLEDEKKLSFIKAWEESEKAKVDNRAQKKLAEEQLEKKKAVYAEKMMNKTALIRKQAEEKRAMVEVQRGQATLTAEEMAAKYMATGHLPKKGFACLGG